MPDQVLEYARSIASLPDHPDSALFPYGTGARYRFPDPRDYRLEEHPDVAAALETGVPESFSLESFVRAIYNQGQEPSCVAFSFAGLLSLEKQEDRQQWITFDGHKFYRENGGMGQNGLDPSAVIVKAQKDGIPELGTTRRFRYGTYAFVPMPPGNQFRDTIKAAVYVGKPCSLALGLPSNFSKESSGTPTNLYHQVVAVGWRPNAVRILNSWGEWFGDKGFCWIPWDYFDQSGVWAWAYAVTDDLDDGLKPGPKPDPTPGPTPPPISPVSVLSVAPAVLNPGDLCIITGRGFGAQRGSVSIGPLPLAITGWADTSIDARVPAAISAQVSTFATVTRADGVAGYSPAGVTVRPSPTPVGPFAVTIRIARLSPTRIRISVQIAGGKAPLKVVGDVSGRILPNLPGARAFDRDANATAGEVVAITARDSAGMVSTARATA